MTARRDFLRVASGAAVSLVARGQRRDDLYDILIKNGEVRDPGRGYRARADVAIREGKIAAIEPQIPS